jgi:hypothetical protein
MFYWNPNAESLKEWCPKSGWNTTFTPEDKIICTNLFFSFKKKGYDEATAESLSQMAIYKRKYHSLTYSVEQEEMLTNALSFRGEA